MDYLLRHYMIFYSISFVFYSLQQYISFVQLTSVQNTVDILQEGVANEVCICQQ